MLLKKFALIPLLAVTGACVTREPQKIVIDTSCLNFRAISYAQLPKGSMDDPGNKADTDMTVQEIDSHNAKYDTLCKKGDAQ